MDLDYKGLQLYAFLDPAGGKKGTIKSTRARSAIIVIGVDDLERIFTLYAWADRASTEKIIERVFKVQEQYKPRRFGCEANAQQSLFAGAVSYTAKYQGRALAFTPVVNPTKITKEFRIRTILQPIIADGRLFVKPEMHELRTELTSFPVGATVDLVDALASCCSLVPPRSNQRQIDYEQDALVEYLQDSGIAEGDMDLYLRDLEDNYNGKLDFSGTRGAQPNRHRALHPVGDEDERDGES